MNPLSGSNRVPLSPRRTSSFLPSSSSIPPHGYTPPFGIPSYLRHSSYHSHFYTTPLISPPSSDSSTASVTSIGESEEKIPLPTHWDEGDKCALLELGSDRLVASFAGSAKYGDRDAAAVRANRPVPSQTGVYYFEVEILNKGVSGYIGIGLSHRSVSLSRLPGWESLSYGYHADDGRAFCCQGTGEPFGPTFTTGDIVGCGIDWTDAGGDKGKRERDGSKKGKEKSKEKGSGRVFYTKNGVFLGYAFSNLSGDLYPTIGLRTPNESVRVNFGQAPFKFDIESLVLDRKRTILSRIMNPTSLPSEYYLPLSQTPSPPIPTLSSSGRPTSTPSPTFERDRLHETLQDLIKGYLKHCGYDDTARSFERQVRKERQDRGEGIIVTDPKKEGLGFERKLEEEEGENEMRDGTGSGTGGGSSAELRSKILGLAMTDRTKEALELVQEHYPAVLEGGDGEGEELVFKLRGREFVEAVLSYSRIENSQSIKGKGKSHGVSEDQDVDMSSSFLSTGSSTSSTTTITIDELLTLGRSLHSTYSSNVSPNVQGELQATLGLMAYRNPEVDAAEGKARRIVRGDEKERVVERLNRAILKASNLPPQPGLELMFRHAIASVQYATELGSGGAALVDVRREVLGE